MYSILKTIALKLNFNTIFYPFGIRFLIKNRKFWRGEYKDIKLDNGYILVEINSNIFLTLGTAILANYIAIVKKLKIIYISFGSKNQEDFLIDVRHSFLNAEFCTLMILL